MDALLLGCFADRPSTPPEVFSSDSRHHFGALGDLSRKAKCAVSTPGMPLAHLGAEAESLLFIHRLPTRTGF